MKIEFNPKSLIGKHRYPLEQLILYKFSDNIWKFSLFANPRLVGYDIIIPYSESHKRKIMLNELKKALNKLEEIGI